MRCVHQADAQLLQQGLPRASNGCLGHRVRLQRGVRLSGDISHEGLLDL